MYLKSRMVSFYPSWTSYRIAKVDSQWPLLLGETTGRCTLVYGAYLPGHYMRLLPGSMSCVYLAIVWPYLLFVMLPVVVAYSYSMTTGSRILTVSVAAPSAYLVFS